MVFLKAEAFFKDHTNDSIRLLKSSKDSVPAAWLIEFRKAARGAASGVIGTPAKTFALRRSIITIQDNGIGKVGWRSRYAKAQNRGYSDSGIYYSNYTTAGTGAGCFAEAAFKYANSQLPRIAREQGLTK